jgi:CHAT domain-containing protein
MVFAPISREVVDKRLIIVPDGFLNYIPFAALLDVTPAEVNPSHPRPLILNHEIVNVPSAATLSLLLRQNARRRQTLKTVAVLADPVFSREDERVSPQASSTTKDRQVQSDDGERDHRGQTGTRRDSGNARSSRIGLTRLYYSREEARRIVAATPTGQGVAELGFDANREAVLNGNLKNYHIIHFATHAVVNEKRPELSGLVLSLVDKRGRAQDGFLGLEDIYNLNLPADLVVLSACNTASGKEAQGEGVIGLTHAFLYAGSSRVLASLWEVDDHPAADLMGWFYEAMEKGGMSPAAALREAQIRMWQNPNRRAPYFWAAFQLQGEN